MAVKRVASAADRDMVIIFRSLLNPGSVLVLLALACLAIPVLPHWYGSVNTTRP